MAKLLLVEDDVPLQESIASALERSNYAVEAVSSGEEAFHRLQSYGYDGIILDWELAGAMSGVDLCKKHRLSGGTTPILMLTGRESPADKEQGLDTGADDYLTKPFDMREFMARVRAILRRPRPFAGNVLTVGVLQLNSNAREVTVDGKQIALQPLEFSVLELFMRHPGEVIPLEALLGRIWTADAEPSIDSVYSAIKKLRKKISGKQSPVIRTIYGTGYVLEVNEQK